MQDLFGAFCVLGFLVPHSFKSFWIYLSIHYKYASLALLCYETKKDASKSKFRVGLCRWPIHQPPSNNVLKSIFLVPYRVECRHVTRYINSTTHALNWPFSSNFWAVTCRVLSTLCLYFLLRLRNLLRRLIRVKIDLNQINH